MNMYRMARNSIEKGKSDAPFAYVIPHTQKDPNTVAKMINILIAGGVEFHQDQWNPSNRKTANIRQGPMSF